MSSYEEVEKIYNYKNIYGKDIQVKRKYYRKTEKGPYKKKTKIEKDNSEELEKLKEYVMSLDNVKNKTYSKILKDSETGLTMREAYQVIKLYNAWDKEKQKLKRYDTVNKIREAVGYLFKNSDNENLGEEVKRYLLEKKKIDVNLSFINNVLQIIRPQISLQDEKTKIDNILEE